MINTTKQMELYWRFIVISCLALVTLILPEAAFAGTPPASSAELNNILCRSVKFLQGTPAQAVATLAVIVLGIGAFFGKLQWGTVVLVAVGLGMVFGAVTIVNAVAGNTGC